MELTAPYTHKLTDNQINNLIVSALEGGSNYWYTITRHNKKEIQDKHKAQVFLSELIMFDGGWIKVGDIEDYPEEQDEKATIIDKAKFVEGIQVACTKYPSIFSAIIKDNADASTADVCLQCAIYGKEIFS